MLMMRGIACLLLVFSCIALAQVNQSQPPSPSPPKLSETPKNDAKSNENGTTTHQHSADNYSVTVNVLPPTNADKEPEQEAGKHDQEPAHDWGLIIPTWILAAATIGLFIFTARLWSSTSRLVRHTKKSSRIELRAYVKMSHVLPGISLEDGEYWVRMQFKNFGKTPARVTQTFFSHRELTAREQLAAIPEYGALGRNRVEAFLVENDSFSVTMPILVDPNDVPEIESGKKIMILFGFVDYIDAFNGRHRAGYGREYVQGLGKGFDERSSYVSDEEFKARSNLAFVEQSGYNYDRPRKKGEGNDWGEAPPV
jgi:hypothetical protein